jgi:hypothetical protein
MPIVVGVPRSGTTLLRMMLDAHPELAVPPETGFLVPLSDLPDTLEAAATAAQTIETTHTWRDFHVDRAAFEASVADAKGPRDVARTFYRVYAARFDKGRWGDKTPTYGPAIDRISRFLPEARFIHVIRDGRDVAVSVRRLWFRPGDTLDAIAQDWARGIAATRRAAADVGHYLEVRFERLVAEPAATLADICRFVELAYAPAMLAYHVRAAARLNEHEALYAPDGRLVISKADRHANQRLTTEPPRPDRAGRWRSVLTTEEVDEFERAAGDCLASLGYAPGSRHVW